MPDADRMDSGRAEAAPLLQAHVEHTTDRPTCVVREKTRTDPLADCVADRIADLYMLLMEPIQAYASTVIYVQERTPDHLMMIPYHPT